jgi:hypothetical protein
MKSSQGSLTQIAMGQHRTKPIAQIHNIMITEHP